MNKDKKKKNVWIVNQYISTPKINGSSHRHYYLAKYFYKHNYNVTLITSQFSHTHKKNFKSSNHFEILTEDKLNLVLIKTPTYSEANSIGRIWNMVIFMAKLFFFPWKKVAKPDVIIVSSISLLPVLNGLYFRWRLNCKLILEIRDIWPKTLIELGNFSPYNPFVLFLGWIEKLGYKNYDFLTSNLPQANLHFKQVLKKKKFKYEWISNGVEPQQSNLKLNHDLNKRIDTSTFNIGYAGALGRANAMNYLIKAAQDIAYDNRFHFYIAGTGYLQSNLIEQSKGYDNITFLGNIPYLEVQSFFSKMDLLYTGCLKSPLYEFGISSIKIFHYMLSAKPILFSGQIPRNPISDSNCGWAIPSENSDAIVETILKISTEPKSYLIKLGENGFNYVMKNFTYEYLSNKYIKIFNELNDL